MRLLKHPCSVARPISILKVDLSLSFCELCSSVPGMHGMTWVALRMTQVHGGAAYNLCGGLDDVADVHITGMPARAGDRPRLWRDMGKVKHHCQGDLLWPRVAGQPPHHDAVLRSGELALLSCPKQRVNIGTLSTCALDFIPLITQTCPQCCAEHFCCSLHHSILLPTSSLGDI